MMRRDDRWSIPHAFHPRTPMRTASYRLVATRPRSPALASPPSKVTLSGKTSIVITPPARATVWKIGNSIPCLTDSISLRWCVCSRGSLISATTITTSTATT